MMGLFRKLKKPDPEAEERLLREIEENGGLEKDDVKAMILSALLVFVPVAAGMLGLLGLVAVLFFR